MSTPEDFKRNYFCTFEPDPRTRALHEKLQQYYAETESDTVSNREAFRKWKEFRSWCQWNGYTVEEINAAKRAGLRP